MMSCFNLYLLMLSFFVGELSGDNVEVAIVGTDGKFKVLTPEEVSDYLREVE